MISFVTGIPGSGKGVTAMRNIREDLLETERYVVTNIPLLCGKLSAYLQKNYGWSGDINERVRILTPDEVFDFWRFRSADVVLPMGPDSLLKRSGERGRKMEKPDFVARMIEILQQAPKGVQYHIDEAHTFFDAREWADTGRELTYVASQHRHLDDNWVFYSQNPEQVEKRLRMLAHSRWEVINNYTRSFGPFRRKGGFELRGYNRCPEKLSGAPFAVEKWKLDKPLCDCYETTGAITPTGVAAPEKKTKVRGMPWWMLYAFAGAAVVALFFVLIGAPKVVSKMVSSMITRPASEASKRPAVKIQPAAVGGQPVVAPLSPSLTAIPASAMQGGGGGLVWSADGAHVVSIMTINGHPYVRLSDGREYTGTDRELEIVERKRVRIAGAWYPVAEAKIRAVQ